MSQSIHQISKVRLHFSLALEDGTIVDSTSDGEPMEFQMGDGTLIEGLEMALVGLSAGDKQTLSIPPETGYGFADAEHTHVLPLADFAEELKPEPGLIMSFDLPNGEHVPGTVIAVEGNQVKVDFNHPLAGREVVFSVEILEVS